MHPITKFLPIYTVLSLYCIVFGLNYSIIYCPNNLNQFLQHTVVGIVSEKKDYPNNKVNLDRDFNYSLSVERKKEKQNEYTARIKVMYDSRFVKDQEGELLYKIFFYCRLENCKY